MTILARPRRGNSKATQPINHRNQFIKEKPFELSKSARGKVYIYACKYSNALRKGGSLSQWDPGSWRKGPRRPTVLGESRDCTPTLAFWLGVLYLGSYNEFLVNSAFCLKPETEVLLNCQILQQPFYSEFLQITFFSWGTPYRRVYKYGVYSLMNVYRCLRPCDLHQIKIQNISRAPDSSLMPPSASTPG